MVVAILVMISLFLVKLKVNTTKPCEQFYKLPKKETYDLDLTNVSLINCILYLYGHEFTLVTDHKPLELIYQNPRSRPSARLERWCLRLQDYTFQVKYRPGLTNPSDCLSRHPLPEYHSMNKSSKPNLANQHVHFLAQNAVPVALSIEQLCKATKQDSTLQGLI